MDRLAHITTSITVALFVGGCGYRELKAPCGPDEGAQAALSYAPLQAMLVTVSPERSAGISRWLGLGPIPVSDPCGPMRRINAPLAMASSRSPADDAP